MRTIENKALGDILFIQMNLLFFVMKPFDVVLPCGENIDLLRELVVCNNDMCHGTLKMQVNNETSSNLWSCLITTFRGGEWNVSLNMRNDECINSPNRMEPTRSLILENEWLQ